jgi:hypothetical protein
MCAGVVHVWAFVRRRLLLGREGAGAFHLPWGLLLPARSMRDNGEQKERGRARAQSMEQSKGWKDARKGKKKKKLDAQ